MSHTHERRQEQTGKPRLVTQSEAVEVEHRATGDCMDGINAVDRRPPDLQVEKIGSRLLGPQGDVIERQQRRRDLAGSGDGFNPAACLTDHALHLRL